MLLFDWPLWGLAVLYFVLSFAMQRVINRLPLFCSLFWPAISSWGILWTVVGYTVVAEHFWADSTLWEHTGRLAFIFVAALPGMWIAYRNQTTILIEIFKQFKINKKTTGYVIFFRELFDDDDDEADSNWLDDISNDTGNGSNGPCRVQPARRRVASYRRWYRN